MLTKTANGLEGASTLSTRELRLLQRIPFFSQLLSILTDGAAQSRAKLTLSILSADHAATTQLNGHGKRGPIQRYLNVSLRLSTPCRIVKPASAFRPSQIWRKPAKADPFRNFSLQCVRCYGYQIVGHNQTCRYFENPFLEGVDAARDREITEPKKQCPYKPDFVLLAHGGVCAPLHLHAASNRRSWLEGFNYIRFGEADREPHHSAEAEDASTAPPNADPVSDSLVSNDKTE